MTMEIHLKRWGNSLGLRIPKGIADAAGFKVDDAVSIDTSQDGLIVKKARRKYDLVELVNKITPENRHEAIDLGGPKGRELL